MVWSVEVEGRSFCGMRLFYRTQARMQRNAVRVSLTKTFYSNRKGEAKVVIESREKNVYNENSKSDSANNQEVTKHLPTVNSRSRQFHNGDHEFRWELTKRAEAQRSVVEYP